ncbi:MAG: ABC transporter ATP-binding protein [Gammaproteobacteria bacterium]|nr:ABC transporter ATP-binding protein [Gammaproteobacteria bacterium]
MSSVITLDNVSVSYKRRRIFRSGGNAKRVLHDISLEVRQGECLGILGRNGAGKSSLLRVLAGIVEPDSGTIVHHGKASLLTLQAGFIESLSGMENIILGGMMLGASRRFIKQKIDAIIEFSELAEDIQEPLYTYSSGMRARLGFSVAYHVDPEIILIDEVLGVGDADFRKKSSAAMKDKINSNRTIVLVSHNAATIRENCNRAIFIQDGRVALEGVPEEVLREAGL